MSVHHLRQRILTVLDRGGEDIGFIFPTPKGYEAMSLDEEYLDLFASEEAAKAAVFAHSGRVA